MNRQDLQKMIIWMISIGLGIDDIAYFVSAAIDGAILNAAA